MNNKILGLFKSHFSIGKSILTLEEIPSEKNKRKEYPVSIFDLYTKNKLDTLVLVDNSISGLLQANKYCKEYKINLIFGVILTICHDINDKTDTSFNTEAKYIIFIKNTDGYKDLIKIYSKASTDGFYYYPRIDWKTLKQLWTKNLKLCMPFYDSCIFLNTLYSRNHIPELDFLNEPLTCFIEDNNLPFDDLIKNKVLNFSKSNNYETLDTQSIYYKSSEDFLSYLTFRCINNRTTCSCPNLNHLSSNTFNFDRWFKNNQ